MTPKLLPHDIVYVALRDIEPEEAALIHQYGISVFSTGLLRSAGINLLASLISDKLSDCTDVYISFDTDCLDASVSVGTGLPLPGGIFETEAVRLVQKLLEIMPVICFELTEFNPMLDKNRNTIRITNHILEKVLSELNSRGVPSRRMKKSLVC